MSEPKARSFGGVPLNTVDIFNNRFLDAFNITRAGGNAHVVRSTCCRGLNIPGAGVVNGTTVTGSAALRAYTSTRAFIANGNVGQLADFLNRSTSVTGKGGGFVRNSGLFPENFFVLNPQFTNVTLNCESGQLDVPLAAGPGDEAAVAGLHELDVVHVEPRPRRKRWRRHHRLSGSQQSALNKALLGYHRTHVVHQQRHVRIAVRAGPARCSAIAPGWLQRLVERWQLGGIFSCDFRDASEHHGCRSPRSRRPPPSALRTSLEIFRRASGKVTKLSNGVTYFPGIQQITDPARASVSRR